MKKNAIQSDLKLRQYMIEFGMNVTSYTACSINTVSVIRPPAMLLPASTTSESVTITTAKSTTVGPIQSMPQPSIQQQQQQQLQPHLPPPPPPPPSTLQNRPFRVMPIIIKEEPIDYDEVMSDITVETNAEAFEHRNGHHRTNGIRSTVSTSSSTNSNKSLTPLPIHSMVSINPVNSKSLLVSTQTASDSEYISAYLLTNSDKTKAANIVSVPKRTNPSSISLAAPKSRENPKPISSTPLPSAPLPQQNKQRTNNTTKTTENPEKTKSAHQHSPPTKRSREIARLSDDSSIQNKSLNESAGRQTRQQLKTVEPNMNGHSPPKRQDQQKQQRSRSRNSTPKMDYKSFFSVRELKRRLSIDNASSRRNVKKMASAKAIANKMKPTINRKGASSLTQNRARI